MNGTLKLFGRFFVFALVITIFSFSIFTFSSTPVYAEGSFVFTNHLELGVVSNDVKELQTLLNSKGYNVGIPDGKFGPTTKAQVILFQKANGLTPDGIVGEGVRAFLNGTSTITPTTKTTTTPTIQTTTTSTSLNRTLKLSMTGDDVKALQTFLNNLGYNVGIADGSFGPKTQSAVKLFQTANNLTSDGSVGPMTRGIMNSSSISNSTNNQTSTSGCTSSLGFSTTTGKSCASAPIVSTLGCTSGALFSTVTGASCGTITTALPVGCTSTSLFSTTSGVSCITGLPATPILKLSGGGSSGPSIQKVSPTISGVTIPAQGGTPIATLSDTTQYSATIAWTDSPSVFAASTSYTATITLTAKSGYTLTGVTANHFTVAGATSTNLVNSGIITAVFPATPLIQLTISNPTLTISKAYNSNTTAVVTAGMLAGKIGSEDVTVSATATYDTKNIGTGKSITVVYTLGGGDASHYIKPADYTVATGTITSIQLTIANPSLMTSKQYDRTTGAVVTAGSLIGKVSGDDVTPTAVATYDSPSVNTGKMITVVYTLSGTDAGNYIKPVDRIEYSGAITQKQLTISAPTLTTTKTYNQSTSAVVSANTLSGIVGTEDVSIASTTATYDNANVGTGKTITVAYTITGASAANYIAPVSYTPVNGIITAIQLTIPTQSLTVSKPYNGTTIAAVTAGSLSGVLGGDTVNVSAVANYDTSAQGTNKTITTVYTLSGTQAGNYIKPVDYVVTNGTISASVISIASIVGVTAPIAGATPITTITQSVEYTGTVAWSSSPSTFLPATIYTATITLTAKAGYTLTGVGANLFTVAGTSTPATNGANSGVITAVFPVTDTTIATAAIAGVTAPILGAAPVTTVTATSSYTGTVTWNTNPVSFAASTIYTATITLTPKTGYTLSGVTVNSFTVGGATTVTNSANSGVVTAVFPATLGVISYATPSAVALAPGVTNPVSQAANSFIPLPNATNATGIVNSWVTGTKDRIKFTVTDTTGVSTITINGSAYTSGADYILTSTATPTIVVTTTEGGKLNGVYTFTIAVSANTFIGDSMGGGKVAYILQPGDTGYSASVQHGLIAATADQSTGIRWWNGVNTTTGATGTAVGTGLANTDAIIANQGVTATSYAAGLARAYNGGGYTDWYLPSKDELNKLYLQKTLVGGFTTSPYWSSSEVSSTNSWSQSFGGGNQTSDYKSAPYYVRAIRAF
jgi:peptidoglycan hydrolase-like protein with peptidoglycan-binding domain